MLYLLYCMYMLHTYIRQLSHQRRSFIFIFIFGTLKPFYPVSTINIYYIDWFSLLINTVNPKLPFSMDPEYQAAQRAYMRYHNMNPIFGISSKYVYFCWVLLCL